MGKTIAVIVIIILSLACGALGYEALRQQSENQDLTKKVETLENDLLVLKRGFEPRPASAKAPAQTQGNVSASLTALQTQLDLLVETNNELRQKLQEHEEKLSQLQKLRASGASGGGIPDETTEEQKKALEEAVRRELKAQDEKRAEAIKSMVMQRFNAELQKSAEKLDLAPMQKDDITNLVKRQVEKGFKTVMEAFEKGDLEAAREPIRQIIEETYAEIDKLLDADQIEKLKELDKDGFGRWKEQQQGR
jgi:hypothetical protein